MMQLLKGISPKGWLDLSQKLGVSGVLLYMAWHFGNRLMDNDEDFRNSIVQSQERSAKSIDRAANAIAAVEGVTRGILSAERKQTEVLDEMKKYRDANAKHLTTAEAFMVDVLKEESRQTTALEAVLKEAKKVN